MVNLTEIAYNLSVVLHKLSSRQSDEIIKNEVFTIICNQLEAILPQLNTVEKQKLEQMMLHYRKTEALHEPD